MNDSAQYLAYFAAASVSELCRILDFLRARAFSKPKPTKRARILDKSWNTPG